MAAGDLLQRHLELWQAATRHRFLDGIKDGTLPERAFKRWLAQDYLFVADLLWFQARLLARAPRPAQAALAGGLVALEAELGWFEVRSSDVGVALDAARLPATAAYRALLEQLDAGDYPAGMVALWALERAYLEAWQSARPGAPAYREFAEHWTTPGFADYVAALERAAENALAAPD
ncbi:MAG: TenA family transcriptional regulator, partial [Chloroflexota bacterium]|nr:TenA family transcriptional regulator [Chloroflexota bacterium]